MVRRRGSVLLTVLALLATMVVSASSWSVPVPPASAPVAEAPDEASASAAARRQGTRVEVASLRTETARTFANPGGTWTIEQSVGPERVRRGAGWVPVDTSLTRAPDGALTPRATPVGVAISAGGTAPLARLSLGGTELRLTWPAPLPEPEIDDDTATYPDVLPGVDLRVVATDQGIAPGLVVRTRAAATAPELARLRFGLSATGLRLAVDAAGNLSGTDPSGAVVYTAGAPLMWDGPTGDAPRTERPVGVEFGAGALTLLPDRELLADPTAALPFVIDTAHSFHTPTAENSWTLLRRSHPTTSHWNLRPGNDQDLQVKGVARVGHAPGWPSTYQDRSVFQFGIAPVRGASVHKATFKIYQVWKNSNSCDPADVDPLELYRTSQIGPGTTWNSPLSWGQNPESAVRSVPKLSHCAPDWVGLNVVDLVRDAAAANSGVVTVGLRANDEVGDNGWKRFYVQSGFYPKIEIEFNRRPAVPSGVDVSPPLSPCRWCAGETYAPDTELSLIGRVHDDDGGQVTAKWAITPSPGAREQTVASGKPVTTKIRTSDYPENTRVTWSIRASDGELDSAPVNGPSFVVDTIDPATPVVASTTYPPDNAWHGGVGVPGTFTFTPSDDAPNDDIDHYLWSWGSGPVTKVDADSLGGGTSASIAPVGDGPRTLYVQSVDRAGNRSEPPTQYRFYVRAGNGALSQWSFEGNAQDTAFLGDNHGTVTGPATYVQGAVGTAIDFERGGTATAPHAVPTDASFTAAAWVRVDEVNRTHTAVSQNGVDVGAFQLGFRGEADGTGRWFFWMARTPDAGSAMTTLWSTGLAPRGVWTHLAGVYDHAKGEMRLYVDGVESGRLAHRSTWSQAGDVHIGNALMGGVYQNHWMGGVDEVRLYDRVVTAAELETIVAGNNVQLAHWKFDERAGSSDPGTSAANAVAGGDMAVLSEQGARFVTPGASGDPGTGALSLDGEHGYATTNEPTLPTDQSFTIAAFVWLDRTGAGTNPVITQLGDDICAVCLQYQANTGKWVFVLPRSDDADPPDGHDFVQSVDDAVARKWTHLVGVYDAAGPEIRLYVDGVLAGRSARPVSWRATGAFQIGRGNPTDLFHGEIDEVRLYSRAISEDEIRGIVSAEDVTEGTWKLDGDVNDDSDNARHGELAGEPAWVAGQTSSPDPADLAVRLTGSPAEYVSAPHAVDTGQSFSVGVWVRAEQSGRQAAVVSEDGTVVSGFMLRSTTAGRWSFAMPRQDVSGGGGIDEVVGPVVQPGVWTHLAGVYSTSGDRLELYVNGELANVATRTGAGFTAPGRVQIGRAKMNGLPVDSFAGAVDDVSIHSRPLFVDEIRAMSGRDLSLVHDWRLDERGGTVAADSVGARGGTLSGGAAFDSGRVGNSVELDGTDGVVSTGGVDLRTDSGFAVSAWVRLDGARLRACPGVCRYTAVSLDGPTHSKFRLGQQIDTDQSQWGRWVFELPRPDGLVDEAAVSVLPGDLDAWVHLVGVYDAATRKSWLYVDGNRVDDGTLDTPWHAGGPLRIGRGQADGQEVDHWAGGVDEVRMYTGALDKDRVNALFRSFPAAAAPAELPAADAGHWTFDEGAGPVADDANGRLPATLAGGATRTDGRQGHAVWLDGDDDHAETAGPALRTDESFAVSAWVYLAADPTADKVILGQDGTQVSAFQLRYDAAARRWAVLVPDGDRPDPATVVLASTEVAGPSDWTHLTAVYDAVEHELRLYVNGVLSAMRLDVDVLASAGPFTIGRGTWNGTPTGFFPGGVDDVRAFGRALTGGEVRRVHDAVRATEYGSWRFDDDNGDDYSLRANHAVAAGGVSYEDGISGRAVRLDGTDDALTTTTVGVTMRDSFTVSAWARLTRADRVATVVAQDGARMSGYFLQYRPELNRWVFGTRVEDVDGSPVSLVQAPQPVRLGVWTHVAGVYDSAARELRLYVDGHQVAARGTGALWPATGGFTIGRGKVDGAAAEFFPGAVDEARVDVGVAADEDIARWAGWPAPPPGTLGGFVDAIGDHRTGLTGEPVPAGYRFETPLGILAGAGEPGTHVLYSCVSGTDSFTSAEAACEGGEVLGELGRVHTDPPEGVPTVPVYRCSAGPDRFDALDCGAATVDRLLGHTVAYAPLARYYSPSGGDHWSATGGTPPAYRFEFTLGWIPLSPRVDTVPLLSCRSGIDQFVSVDAGCEGGQVLGTTGHLWPTRPSDVDSRAVYRCAVGGQRFLSVREDCEGQSVDRLLGHVSAASPVPGS